MAASPWSQIDKAEVSFLEVQDEAVAEKLQKEENKIFTKQILEDIKVTKQLTPDPDPNEPGCSKATASSSTTKPDVILPEEVLAAMQLEQSEIDSDALIAQVLQAQFDLEFDAEIRREEKVKNKNSKISVSYKNFRSFPDAVLDENYLELDNNELELNKKDWDRFDTAEKEFDSMPKCGYKYDEEGAIVTKHNAELNGRRNACKVMSLPTHVSTGDAGGFDMKLNNRVFNELRKYSQKTRKMNRANDRKENAATAEMGVDNPTRLILFKMINSQILETVDGIVSTGKEAVILHAHTDPTSEEMPSLPKEVAVKIFKTTLNEFKQRDRYIKDDYRFKDRFSKNNARQVINMWAEKELHNLLKLKRAGIPCPEVVVLKKHVLVMSFLGVDGVPALKLKEAVLSDAELSVAYEEILEIMHKLYDEARLVHADFSEYNILWHEGKCWIIDVAQSVAPDHPGALEFLMRDCGNIVSFFKRQGVPNVKTKEELFFDITKLDPLTHNAAQLERIHMKGAPPHMVDRTSSEDTPDKFKAMVYPFDFAWDQVQQYKLDLNDSDDDVEDDDAETPKESEWQTATKSSKSKVTKKHPLPEKGSTAPTVTVKNG